MRIEIKRVYEPAEITDGYRVLVDRLWPRGIKKAELPHDVWLKDVAPSDELRTWFGHKAERFDEFRQRYEQELHDSAAFAELVETVKTVDERAVTLLYAAKDEEHNQAVVLAEVLKAKLT